MRTTFNYKGQTIKQNSEHRFYVNRFNDEYDGVAMFTSEDRAKAYIDKHLTYDVVFNDENDSNCKGFKSSIEECKKYKELNIHERINLKSWYKQYFAFPWAYVSVRDAERGGYRHYEEWMRQPIRQH